MPIYSMTGFARVQVRVNDQLSYTLSVKSVNHRFLDVQLRQPPGLDALEMELRRALKEQLVRGHIELTLSIDRAAHWTKMESNFPTVPVFDIAVHPRAILDYPRVPDDLKRAIEHAVVDRDARQAA